MSGAGLSLSTRGGRRRRSGFDPASIAKFWYRLEVGAGKSVITGAGYSSVWDVLGGSPAVQTNNAQRPINGTSGNGIPTAEFVNDGSGRMLQAPLSNARNNGSPDWWIAAWIQLSGVVGTGGIWEVNTTSSAASANRIRFRRNTSEVMVEVFESGGVNVRRGITTGVALSVGPWIHVFCGYRGGQAAEADRARVYINGSPKVLTFSANPTSTAMPPTLVQPTGVACLGATSIAGAGVLTGKIAGNVFGGDTNPTDAQIINLMNIDMPVG